MSIFDEPALRRDGLRTDLYQLTMMAAMHVAGIEHEATFEVSTRRLAPQRGFWVACGVDQVLDYLEGLRCDPEQVAWLRSHPSFRAVPESFFRALSEFRFTGDVWAPAEGTPVFPQEPLLRITAPAIQAQLVETYVLSVMNFQTLIAAKAARVREACRGKAFIDFGTRRAHGPEAGELVARASYIAGAKGTSNVEAGHRLGVPVFGTFAHSWVMMWEDEDEAFRRYAQAFPDASTLLIDTYDTVAAARRIVEKKLPCRAVRIDSGDLVALSREVRKIFDEGGRQDIAMVLVGRRIDGVEMKDVDVIEAEPPQARIELAGDRLGRLVAAPEDCLGRDHQLLPVVKPGGRAHNLLGAVGLGGVEEVDTQFDCRAYHRHAVLDAGAAAEAEAAVAAAAEPGDADGESGVSEGTIVHHALLSDLGSGYRRRLLRKPARSTAIGLLPTAG